MLAPHHPPLTMTLQSPPVEYTIVRCLNACGTASGMLHSTSIRPSLIRTPLHLVDPAIEAGMSHKMELPACRGSQRITPKRNPMSS